MAGHEVGEGVGDGDDRFVKIALFGAGSTPERAGASHIAAMGRGTGTVCGHRRGALSVVNWANDASAAPRMDGEIHRRQRVFPQPRRIVLFEHAVIYVMEWCRKREGSGTGFEGGGAGDNALRWSGRRESNPRLKLGKLG